MTSSPERRLAAGLRRRGLGAPARLLADAHRPIAPLLTDLAAAAGPLLGVLGLDGARRLLSNERMLDELIDELDVTEPSGARSE
jgi:hypothetical protein